MKHRLLTLISFGAIVIASAQASAAPKATIDSGVVAGSEEQQANVFKGIPFAQPPIGALRWAAPVKPAAWQGERDATRFSLPCPQPINADGTPNGGGVSGKYSEDCLYLNVWAPKQAKNAPVMLWLYGGASFLGAGSLGSYNGSAFARDGVIVVTINYRLGATGMFAHPALTKASAPKDPLGHYALLDAIEGLRWVQRNIKSFGGDPGNVTLFGQSAGGAMTTALLTTPAAKGLYHKAIVQSGALLRPGPTLAEAEATGAKIATSLGLPGEAATLEELRAVPIEKLVGTEASRRGIFGIIDGRLRVSPTEATFSSGRAIDVPLLVGNNNGEGGADAARSLARMASSGAPSFLYQFAYVPEWRQQEQPKGAIHSAELVYVFESWSTSSYGGPKVTPKEHAVSAKVHSCWVAFAKATPSDRTLQCAGNYSWPAYTEQNDAITVFGSQVELKKAAELPKFVPTPAT